MADDIVLMSRWILKMTDINRYEINRVNLQVEVSIRPSNTELFCEDALIG
jgi:hypothetical protein